jgi:hypothetical protein
MAGRLCLQSDELTALSTSREAGHNCCCKMLHGEVSLTRTGLLMLQRHGAALEVVTSRMRLIASQVETPIRIVGLCTSLANAKDLGEWIGASSHSLFNFPPGSCLRQHNCADTPQHEDVLHIVGMLCVGQGLRRSSA